MSDRIAVLVVLPALWPAIVAAGLLTFALSFDDFVLSFFTTGEDAAAAAGADLVGDPLRGLADDQRDRDADDGRSRCLPSALAVLLPRLFGRTARSGLRRGAESGDDGAASRAAGARRSGSRA